VVLKIHIIPTKIIIQTKIKGENNFIMKGVMKNTPMKG